MYVPFEAHVSSAEHTSRPCNVACGVSVSMRFCGIAAATGEICCCAEK